MAPNEIDTIVGAQVELKGSLHNQGPILIHGRIIGEISSEANVLVGEGAVVTGPIIAKTVEVAGQVVGNITATEMIELQPKSSVKGDLHCNTLSIKPGANFVGKAQMPLKERAKPEVAKSLESQPSASPSEEFDPQKRKPRLEID